MKHINEIGDPNYDLGAFKKECNKIKLFGGGGKSAPSSPPPPPPAAPPPKEFTPVKPQEQTSMETGGKTGTKALRVDVGGADTSNGTGLNIPK